MRMLSILVNLLLVLSVGVIPSLQNLSKQSYLAPSRVVDWDSTIERYHNKIEKFTGVIKRARLKKSQKENLDQVESVFHNTIPELFSFTDSNVISNDFVQCLLKVKEPNLFFDDSSLTSIVELIQQGSIPTREQANQLWLIYQRQFENVSLLIGKDQTQELFSKIINVRKKRNPLIFHKIIVYKNLYNLFKAYLGSHSLSTELEENVRQASFVLCRSPKSSNSLHAINQSIEYAFKKKTRALSTNLQKQWLIAVYQVAMKGKGATTALDHAINAFNTYFGEIKDQSEEIKKQWLIAVYKVAINGKAATTALDHTINAFNTHLGNIKDQSEEIRKQWLIAVYKVAMEGKAATTALDHTINAFNTHFGEIKDQSEEMRKQWLIAVYAVAMKGKGATTALDHAINAFNTHLGNIKDQSEEIKKQWLIAVYEVAVKGKAATEMLQSTLKENKLPVSAADIEKLRWLRNVYVPISNINLHHNIPIFFDPTENGLTTTVTRTRTVYKPITLHPTSSTHSLNIPIRVTGTSL